MEKSNKELESLLEERENFKSIINSIHEDLRYFEEELNRVKGSILAYTGGCSDCQNGHFPPCTKEGFAFPIESEVMELFEKYNVWGDTNN